MGGISNIYIEHVFKQLPIKYWAGVYSADTIPIELANKNFTIIVNFSNYKEPGTHFVALAQIGDMVLLFDSLATPYEHLPKQLQNIMDEKNGKYLLRHPVQDLVSQYCGFYCIYFVLYIGLPNHIRETGCYSPSLFSMLNLKSNDELCIEMIEQMIKEIK